MNESNYIIKYLINEKSNNLLISDKKKKINGLIKDIIKLNNQMIL
ncbi:hypothetical protein QUF55_04865 [Clostridiaceae bacterium HSG29]|nr:hypothetical protein [Clostridiaceae bacterium HSG29]